MKHVRGIFISAFIAILFCLTVSQHSRTVLGFNLMYVMIGLIYLIQVVVFIPSKIWSTEKLYDLTGSLSYITAVIVSAVTSPSLNLHQQLSCALVCIWAVRLGSFLFIRVLFVGEDSRFAKIKKSTLNFLYVWVVQALWVTITSGPALVILSKQDLQFKTSLGAIELVGLSMWVVGFLIQTLADWHKFTFNNKHENKGKFIDEGLWSISRHPNYCGQIMVWTGVAIFVFPSLQGLEYISLISPIFVYLLLTKLSGVPILESKAMKKWGHDPNYLDYKKRTPVLFPWGSTRSKND